jgi:hypothetical protein
LASGTTPEWRLGLLRKLGRTLAVFDLVLSAIFLSAALLGGSPYFRGVGIGLLIAGVTAAIAYFYGRKLGITS